MKRNPPAIEPTVTPRLADVVHVALHGGDDDLAPGLGVAAGVDQQLFLGFDVGQQVGHRLLAKSLRKN